MTIYLLLTFTIHIFKIKNWHPLTLYTTMHWVDVPCGTPMSSSAPSELINNHAHTNTKVVDNKTSTSSVTSETKIHHSRPLTSNRTYKF